jgi:hypothetical protein
MTQEPNTGCWLWLGQLNRNGYGYVSVGGRKRVAHRVVWEVFVGPVPEGMVLDHTCRVRCCCNPNHIEPVTVRTNTRRGGATLYGG